MRQARCRFSSLPRERHRVPLVGGEEQRGPAQAGGTEASSDALTQDGSARLALGPVRRRACLGCMRPSAREGGGPTEVEGPLLCGPARSLRRRGSRCCHRHHSRIVEGKMEPVTIATDSGDRPGAPAGSGLSASQRRAELRRRKLLMNSEQRINRIMGFHRPGSGAGENLRFPTVSCPSLLSLRDYSSFPFSTLLTFLTKPCFLTSPLAPSL